MVVYKCDLDKIVSAIIHNVAAVSRKDSVGKYRIAIGSIDIRRMKCALCVCICVCPWILGRISSLLNHRACRFGGILPRETGFNLLHYSIIVVTTLLRTYFFLCFSLRPSLSLSLSASPVISQRRPACYSISAYLNKLRSPVISLMSPRRCRRYISLAMIYHNETHRLFISDNV